MFKITPSPTFKTTVSVTLPGDGSETGEFVVEFKYMTPTQLSDWADANGSRQIADVLFDVIIGWDGPVDADGKAVEYTKDNLSQLLSSYYNCADQIFVAFRDGLRGAKTKN